MESKPTLWYRFVRWFIRRVGFPLVGGVDVTGSENIPTEGGVILAPIHLSVADPPLIGCLAPRLVRSMAKEELFKFPLGLLIRSINTFEVKRGEGDRAALKFSMECLKRGEVLLLFPEGTRGTGEVMSPIQNGVGMLAQKTKCRVVPVGIAGTQILLPKGKSKVTRTRCSVHFGQSFLFEDVPGVEGAEPRLAFANFLAARIAECSHTAGLNVRVSESNRPTGAGDSLPSADAN